MPKSIKSSLLIAVVSLFASTTLSAQTIVPELPEKLSFAGERVPMEYFDVREGVERELITTLNMHSSTTQMLINIRRYLGVIDPLLKKYGVPSDFRYLCIAESGLNPNARSSAGAAGLWQIMPSVGRSKGLIVSDEVDERYHLEKSTEAACSILKENYSRFGSWTMAAAAYNLGSGGVNRRIEHQQVENYFDAFFPEETLRYVNRILSFKILIENMSLYNYVIETDDLHRPLTNYHEITIDSAQIDWSEVARDNMTNYKLLRILNPWIRDYTHNNRNKVRYIVKIPNTDFRE